MTFWNLFNNPFDNILNWYKMAFKFGLISTEVSEVRLNDFKIKILVTHKKNNAKSKAWRNINKQQQNYVTNL